MADHYHHHDGATGERFVPEAMGGEFIEAEHQARYRFVLDQAKGQRVLDAGCGVGWGSLLLHQAGASRVVGLDIADEALDQARARTSRVEFASGDLQDMPFEDGEFDIVVCFEALEHVAHTSAALDELVRVLADDGLLFVSSPNPTVYPEGNPFHLHELTPEELSTEAARRLPNVALYRQHQLMASLVISDEAPGATTVFEARTMPVASLEPGTDPYSIVVASRAKLPDLRAWVCLSRTPQPMSEWTTMLAERDGLRAELHNAYEAQRSATHERDAANQNALDLHTQWQATHAQLINQRAVAHNAASERDDLAVRLVAAHQQLGRAATAADQTAELEAAVNDLETELKKKKRQLRLARQKIRTLREAEGATSVRHRRLSLRHRDTDR
jgi:SAM-dependent methyltransferase